MPRLWQGVDHFSGSSVVEFFASLVLNRVWVALQTFYMPLQAIVLPLEIVQLQFKLVSILPLLLVGGQPVLAKDNVISQRERKDSSGTSCGLAPANLDALMPTCQCGRLAGLHTRAVGLSHHFQYKLDAMRRQVENSIALSTYQVRTGLIEIHSLKLVALSN